MILTKKNLIYFGVALLVGLIASFGLTGLTYHPVSLQVQQDIYAPITPSGGAEPTISPQYVPGSYADGNSNTSGDKFAPAQAPQVIPTQVLPTITTVPTSGNNACCAPLANSSRSSAASGVTSTFAVAPSLYIAIIVIGILTIGIVILIGGIDAPGGIGFQGLVGIILAFGGVLIAIYSITIIIGSISAAVTIGICTC